MVQNSIREKAYDLITTVGVHTLSRLFPQQFGKEPLKPSDRHIEYPWVIKNLPKPNWNYDILDVGCIGMFPLLLKAIGYKTWGIDLREHSFKKEFNFYQIDIASNTLIMLDVFDSITAISTIEHIKDAQKAIDNIYKFLKSNGLFLMTVPYGVLKQTRFHLIYDMVTIRDLLKNFSTLDIEIVDSPQKGQIALIKAVK